MKCKKHQNDPTSEIGVCASCLRERLFSLISAQAIEERRESDAQKQPPPSLNYNRSECNRNSNKANLNHNGQLHHSMSEQRFFSTPQVWSSSNGEVINDGDGLKKKKKSRFSVISNLFRSKSDKVRMESTINVTNSNSGESYAATSSSSSPSWFTTMLSTNKKKKSRLFSFHKTTSRPTHSHTTAAAAGGYQDLCEDEDNFERSSGYSSESSYGYKRTPMKTSESARRSGAGRPSHSRNVSGLSNMSPLVRASPSGQLNRKVMAPSPSMIENTNSGGGDVRFPAKTPLSNGSSFSSNRSRKLADVGRFNHNH